MSQSGLPDQRLLHAARLRFAPELEQRFRAMLRGRQRVARTIMFVVLAVAFGLAPFYSHALFQPLETLDGLIRVVDWAITTPVTLLAAGLTFFRCPQVLRQAVQSAAVLAVVASVLAFRALALHGGLQYPAHMTGIVLLAVAFFGSFSWWRTAPLTIAATLVATAMEFRWAVPGAQLQAYALFFMAVIAVLGSYNLEFLTRLSWWDYTHLREIESALRESERRFKSFMDHTPITAWIKDADGRYVYRNKAHLECYGRGGDWTGRRDFDVFPAGDASRYAQTDGEVLRTGRAIEYDIGNCDREGHRRDWWVHKFPLRDERGRMVVAGIGVDVGERKRLERQLAESEARFQAFLDNNPGLSWMKDADGRYVFASASFLEAFGRHDVLGRRDEDFLPESLGRQLRAAERLALESNRTQVSEGFAPGAEGTDRYWVLVTFPFTDSAGRRFTGGIATDITDRKKAEDLVRLQSLSDELTGLYNRRGLHLLADRELRRARRGLLGCSLLCVDLDGLKQINDELGHGAGDRAIVALANVLRVVARGSDVVARIGGDEFVVFSTGSSDGQPLRQRILEQIDAANATGQLPFRLSASVGFVAFKADALAPLEDLLAMADAEMYRIKHGRRRTDIARA